MATPIPFLAADLVYLHQVQAYLASLPHPTELIQTFQECESGRVNSRPQLIAALALAKKHKAKLICSRMDRLTRSVSFLMTLIESNCEFVCLDCLGLDKFGLSVLALVASRERENIAIRTAAGLKIAREKLKAQNRRLGNPRPAEALRKATQANIANKEAFAQSALVSIRELQSVGIHSYNRLALSLNKRGEKTRLGKPWSPMAVKRVLQSTL